ncbi:MAG: tRNA dihydrouridine synthase DusB [Deltaproteobacteria bacterium]|nr:tRNA dihydrouridine synthase DusB [Deltaproteobacteria bacterium]
MLRRAELNSSPLPCPVGATPLFLAPMAGISNGPFRRVCREGGAGLVFTEMISARAFRFGSRRTKEMGVFHPDEHPVAAQIFGREPEEMALAAQYLAEAGAGIIDINMGCPVKKILKSGSGVQLMREPDRAGAIARAVVARVDVPVTAKIRLGWSAMEENYISIARILESEGLSAITLHPRTRVQGYAGDAQWKHIAYLKEAITIPVIGSGDVRTSENAIAMFQTTGCDAVMIGRGAFGKPWIFGEIKSSLEGHPEEADVHFRRRLISTHIDLIIREMPGQRSTVHLRKHLGWYSKGIPGGSDFRREINGLDDPDDIVDLAVEFLGLRQVQC